MRSEYVIAYSSPRGNLGDVSSTESLVFNSSWTLSWCTWAVPAESDDHSKRALVTHFFENLFFAGHFNQNHGYHFEGVSLKKSVCVCGRFHADSELRSYSCSLSIFFERAAAPLPSGSYTTLSACSSMAVECIAHFVLLELFSVFFSLKFVLLLLFKN